MNVELVEKNAICNTERPCWQPMQFMKSCMESLVRWARDKQQLYCQLRFRCQTSQFCQVLNDIVSYKFWITLFQVYYWIGWKPDKSQPKPLKPQKSDVSLLKTFTSNLSTVLQVSLKDLYKLDELAEKKGFTDLNDDSDPKKSEYWRSFHEINMSTPPPEMLLSKDFENQTNGWMGDVIIKCAPTLHYKDK